MFEKTFKPEENNLNDINLKHWISRTIMITIIFLMLIVLTEYTFQISLLSNTLMTIGISVTLGLAHEYLHYHEAVKLGYKPEWYRTRFTMGFEIAHHSDREQWREDKKKISFLPYYVLLPVSLIICGIGLYFDIWGIWLGGVMGVILHSVAYPLTEGH